MRNTSIFDTENGYLDNDSNLVTSPTIYNNGDTSSVTNVFIQTNISIGTVIDEANATIFANVLIPSFVYACVLLAIGLPGNTFVIYVYGCKRKRSISGTFILTLAILDLVNCVFSITTELFLLWNFFKFDYPIICKLSRFITSCCNHSTTVLLLTIAIDRYRKINSPLKNRLKRSTARKIIICSMIFGGLTGIPFWLWYGTKTIPIGISPDHAYVYEAKTCLFDDKTDPGHIKMVLIVLSIAHIVCDISLIVLYSFVGSAVFRSEQSFREPRADSRSSSKRGEVGRRNTSRKISSSSATERPGNAGRTNFMLFLVTLVFILSFVPYLVVAFIRTFQNQADYVNLSSTQKALYHLFLRSYFLSSVMNPVVYCFASRYFRKEAMAGIRRLFSRRKDMRRGVSDRQCVAYKYRVPGEQNNHAGDIQAQPECQQ